MKHKLYVLLIVVLGISLNLKADVNGEIVLPQYSENVYYVNGSCGDDSWRGISPSCSAPNGPKKTIQAAINTAAQEDLIVIYPGTYYENVLINSKNLALTSTDPYDGNIVSTTVINGQYHDSVIKTINSNCLIKGLSIKQGKGFKGGGIYSQGGYLKVKKCIIMNNKTLFGFEPLGFGEEMPENLFFELIPNDNPNGGNGGGIYCDDGLIEDSNVSKNLTGDGAGGYNNPPLGNGGDGAGIYCNGDVNIVSCIIADNNCGDGQNDRGCCSRGGDGGGIYISSLSSTVIMNSKIKNNKGGTEKYYLWAGGGSGGGLYCAGDSEIYDSIITLNSTGPGLSSGNGGGALFTSTSNVKMVDCTISSNKAENGRFSEADGGGQGGSGGGIWCASETAEFEGCNFINNISGNGDSSEYSGFNDGGSGGGILIGAGTHVVINKCKFDGNKTGNGGGAEDSLGGMGGSGGGICNSSNFATIINCVVSNNSTGNGGQTWNYYVNPYWDPRSYGGNGGKGGGIYSERGVVVNCVIANNLTGKGGDAFCSSAQRILNGGNGGNGAGVYCPSGSVINCVVVKNSAGVGGLGINGGINGQNGRGGIYCDVNSVVANSIVWNAGIEQFVGQDSNNIRYCDIMDSDYGDKNGNICAEPFFVNADANDFHLMIDSPCIDAGDNNSVPAEVTSDLEGKPRFFDILTKPDSGRGTAPIVDIGAYEFFFQTIFNETKGTFHTTIQDAVDKATAGDKIILEGGTYGGQGNRDIDFGGKDLTLYSKQNAVINCGGSVLQPHRAFKFVSGETADSVIAGLTIINGFAQTEVCEDGNLYSAGGAIYCKGASPCIRECKFIDNGSNDIGGAIYNQESSSIISNCLFNNNFASATGGAVFSCSGTAKIVNCTFYNNEALAAGGAIRIGDDTQQIFNCIFWGNTAPADSQITGWMPNDVGPFPILYCDIEGGDAYLWNIIDEPLFADAENGDFHLKSQYGRWDEEQEKWVYDDETSPCIDAGANEWEPSSSSFGDWRGELWPNGRRINMGMYGGTAQASMSGWQIGNIADLNNDWTVNYKDFLIFAEAWLSEEILLKEDLNRDGRVDLRDFDVFADNWKWNYIQQE